MTRRRGASLRQWRSSAPPPLPDRSDNMAQGDIPVTAIGNLTADPELRFTPSGAAVANFTVASTPRRLNKDTQQWEDGAPVFLRCSVWRQAAENVAESFTRGDRVVVTGVLRQRSYETKEGEKRTVMECEADEVAASTKWATVKVTKTGRGGGGGGQSSGVGPGDPWSTPSGSYSGDEPPF